MKQIIYFSLLIVLFGAACKTDTGKTGEEQLSPQEKHERDSISKAQQRQHNDSLKRGNPLLIVPPDSTYTGDYVDRYPDGIVKFRGFFRLGKRHGQWMSFYPNGLMWSEMHYDKGVPEGPNKTFFITGKPRYEGRYKNGLKDSVWVFYDSLGVPVKKVTYKKDRIAKQEDMTYVKSKK